MFDQEVLRTVAGKLRTARGALVITGAGVSAESGVPTFRGAGGYWRTFRAEDLASPEGFARDPKLVWEWYNERKTFMRRAEPNAAHHVIAGWEQRFERFLLVTQNVDGLHGRAGSRRLIELHGSIWRSRCMATGRVFQADEADTESVVPPPSPAAPGAILRPDVVWFGEFISEAAIEQIQGFIVDGDADVALVIGTTAAIGYIARWIAQLGELGAYVVEVNPEPCLGPLADAALAGPAGEILPRIEGLLREERT